MAAQLEFTQVAILLMGVAVVAVGCGWILARSYCPTVSKGAASASAGEIEGVIAAVIELANDKLAATTDRIASQVEQSGLLRDQVFDHRTDVVQSELVEAPEPHLRKSPLQLRRYSRIEPFNIRS